MLRHLCLLMICLFSLIQTVFADNISWKETRIPMEAAGPNGLEALLVWPNTPGKHPLALISHGSPRDAKDRLQMTAISYLPIAMEFARRGFSVAVVLRRGYGKSGGEWKETYGTCNSPHYLNAAKISSRDLHAAIQYLGTLPQFDTDKMIAVGVSAGGFATVALTADSPPPGLIAAISFAGGRGSTADNTVCKESELISAFSEMGKTSRTPMLWIYAKNDHFFNPELAQKFFNAFNSSGGKAILIQPDDFQKEGHYLFSTAGIPIWAPIVDQYLQSQNLVLLKEPLSLPAPPNLPLPPKLSSGGKKAFANYLISAPHKAFAIASDGGYGWRSGRNSVSDAKTGAMNNCQKADSTECTVYAVDDKLVSE